MKLDTVRNFINFNYENNPNLEFITCSTSQKKITNKNLKINLEKINYYLSVKKKQKKNSLICTLTENSLSGIQLMLGIMYSGMIQVPLNLVAGEEQLAYIIGHSESKILFSTKLNLNLAKKIIKKSNRNIELIEIDKDNFIDELRERDSGLNNLDKSDNTLLMYTSGTT